MRTFIVGDIHGHNKALEQVLSKVNFNFEEDTLIQLGDVVDRGPDSFECVETLLKCKNLIAIKGNHDAAWWEGIKTGRTGILDNQGGRETTLSYIKNCNPKKEYIQKMSGTYTTLELSDLPESHIKFFDNQLFYYIDKDNNCFIHGGFNRHYLLEEENQKEIFYWDRDLLMSARSYSSMKNNKYPFKIKNKFKTIFIGHTPVQYFGESTPQKCANIWDLDTGCGKGDNCTLTIMNLETEEYIQSDLIGNLYK